MTGACLPSLSPILVPFLRFFRYSDSPQWCSLHSRSTHPPAFCSVPFWGVHCSPTSTTVRTLASALPVLFLLRFAWRLPAPLALWPGFHRQLTQARWDLLLFEIPGFQRAGSFPLPHTCAAIAGKWRPPQLCSDCFPLDSRSMVPSCCPLHHFARGLSPRSRQWLDTLAYTLLVPPQFTHFPAASLRHDTPICWVPPTRPAKSVFTFPVDAG